MIVPTQSDSKVSRRRFLGAAALAGAAAGAVSLVRRRGLTFAPSAAELVVEKDGLSRLRSSLKGTLILPGDDRFDAARRVGSFNPLTDKRPAIIALCADAPDVVRSLEFARLNNLEIAVRGGGQDVLGKSVCEGGMVIDLGPMKAIAVDPKHRVVSAQAGLRTGELDDALQAHGLTAALGCHPAVGISGLTLGGGLGWFVGRFGATCDNLLAAEVITADGRRLRASEEENPDLFWGLRGGGGNFGIVTTFEYRVHPVNHVLGGFLAYRGSQIREFLRFYREYMAQAPDELTVEVAMSAPGTPDTPIVMAITSYSGDPRTGERILAPLRSFGPPLADTIAEVSYTRLTDRPPILAGLRMLGPVGTLWAGVGLLRAEPEYGYWKGAYAPALVEPAIEAFAESVSQAPPGWWIGLGHYMHGAVCRVDSRATALPRPSAGYSYFFNAHWRDPAVSQDRMGWVDRSWASMARFSSKGTYINYLSSGSEEAVKASYGDNFSRLVALKNKFDPSNVFHLNRNIRPAA